LHVYNSYNPFRVSSVVRATCRTWRQRNIDLFRILSSVSLQRLLVARLTPFPCMNYTQAISSSLVQSVFSWVSLPCVVPSMTVGFLFTTEISSSTDDSSSSSSSSSSRRIK
jgi:hypothetical protein